MKLLRWRLAERVMMVNSMNTVSSTTITRTATSMTTCATPTQATKVMTCIHVVSKLNAVWFSRNDHDDEETPAICESRPWYYGVSGDVVAIVVVDVSHDDEDDVDSHDGDDDDVYNDDENEDDGKW